MLKRGLLFTAIIWLLGSAVLYYYHLAVLHHVGQQEQRYLRKRAEDLGARLDFWFSARLEQSKMLARNSEVRRFMMAKGGIQDSYYHTARLALESVKASNPLVAAVQLWSAERRPIAWVKRRLLLQLPWQKQRIPTHALQQDGIAPLRFDRSKKPWLLFYAPILGMDGSTVGIASITFDAQIIASMIQRDGGEQAFIVNSDGVVFFDSQQKKSFQSLSRLSKPRAENLLKRHTLPVKQINALALTPLARTLVDASAGDLRFYHHDEKESWLVGFAPLKQMPWRVFVLKPERLVLKPLQSLFNPVIQLGSLFLFLFMMIGYRKLSC
ncbi:cache domain-containing protein [Magnetococcales bacterium HHB-1]